MVHLFDELINLPHTAVAKEQEREATREERVDVYTGFIRK